jgi:hypothetical protein
LWDRLIRFAVSTLNTVLLKIFLKCDSPVALEGALKLKEISYMHAEGYAAGEMKHGPIALIEPGVPVVVVAPKGPLYDKTLSAMQEVRAREGHVIAIATEGDDRRWGCGPEKFTFMWPIRLPSSWINRSHHCVAKLQLDFPLRQAKV